MQQAGLQASLVGRYWLALKKETQHFNRSGVNFVLWCMGTFWGRKTKPNCDKYLQNVQWQFCREKNTAFGNYELRILNVDLSCGITSQFLQRLFFCEGFAKRGERE